MKFDGVVAHVSGEFRGIDGVWAAIEAMEQRFKWEAIDPDLRPPALSGPCLPWLYFKTDFPYSSHVDLAKETGLVEPTCTQYPLVVLLLEVSGLDNATDVMRDVVAWFADPARPFVRSRLVLLLVHSASFAGGKPAVVGSLAACLIHHHVAVVEVGSHVHAANYVAQSAAAIAESKRRRLPSRFKVVGSRCQTLPRDKGDSLRITWVSQLMQVPGVSEEIAKAIAERHPSPGSLLQTVMELDSTGASLRSPDVHPASGFLADLEYPIRGKKGTRRIGPIVSRRIFAMFHAMTPPDHTLI